MSQKKFKFADRLIERAVAGREKELILIYRDSLKEIRSQLALAVERYGSDFAEMNKYGRLIKLENAIAKEIQKLSRRAITVTRGAVADTYKTAYYTTGWVFESELSTRLGFATLPTKAIENAIYSPFDPLKWSERLRENSRLLNRQVREAITRGLIQGEGYRDIARAIRDPMEKSAYRAERIIRTETHRVQVQGRLDGFEHAQNMGIEFDMQWVAALDGRTRDSHRDMDGQISVDGIFTFPSGGTTTGPGFSGIPEEDINCRCAVIAKLAEQTERRASGGVIIPNMTYREWENLKVS